MTVKAASVDSFSPGFAYTSKSCSSSAGGLPSFNCTLEVSGPGGGIYSVTVRYQVYYDAADATMYAEIYRDNAGGTFTESKDKALVKIDVVSHAITEAQVNTLIDYAFQFGQSLFPKPIQTLRPTLTPYRTPTRTPIVINSYSPIPIAKTCGEYVDIYSGFGDLLSPQGLDDFQKNRTPNFSQPKVIKTQGDKFFPADKIESIWGKKIVYTTYFDSITAARANEEIKRIQEQGQKLLDLIPPQLRSQAGTGTLGNSEPALPVANSHAGQTYYAECTINFSILDASNAKSFLDSLKDKIMVGYAEFSGQAPKYSKNDFFSGVPQSSIKDFETSNKIGDNYYYIDVSFSGGGASFDYLAVAASQGKYSASVLFYDPAKRAQAEEILRLILNQAGGAISTTTDSSSSSASPKITDQAPIIDSVTTSPTSAVLSAGKEFFHDQIGIVTFVDNNLILVIKGKNLNGAVLKTDNIGLDGRPGIEFRDIRVSADGTMVAAQTTIKPTAKEGNTLLTLTNAAGKSATAKIEILITGTQYLQRKFADNSNVKFFGDWPDYMPYQRVLDLEKSVRKGLQAINKNTYNRLGIMIQIYEMSSWKNFQMAKYCPLSFAVAGCASPSDRVIYVSEYISPDSDKTTGTVILHESAHKLHFYYEGNYAPVPSTANNFDGEWKAILGNLKSCSYLPLLNDNSWSDKTRKPSRCGFDWSYGAYRVQDLLLPKFYEDVATSTETARLNPAKLNQNKASGDSRYGQKAGLLDKYGF